MFKINFFNKIKEKISSKLELLFKNENKNNIELLSKILIEADVSQNLVEKIQKEIEKKNIKNISELKIELYKIMQDIVKKCEKKIILNDTIPFVILLVGVNGVGKTTTVVKLANLFKNQNKKVLVVAGDTYRAAAIEQLDILCKKNSIPIIKQHANADSAAVIFDAFNIAKNKNIDIMITDTSGRLHNNDTLMNNLKKIDTVIKKINNKGPNETILVLDLNTGQNSINQVEKFSNYIKISGLILTKIDSTAKGGAILSIANKNIPIMYVCNGENIHNIQEFNSEYYIKNLLNME
ncbi:MAG TPA: signal recognition particle-docking protein FtsY [Candidatus Azoamicus sp.]